jgi:hypothetical protein
MRAVAKELAPRRDELARLLSQLDDASSGPSSLARPVSLETDRRNGVTGSKLGLLLDLFSGVRVEPVATAKLTVLVAKSIALVTLIFCLFIAFCLFISQVVGAFDFGALSGYLIYCVVTWLLAWDLYRAKPVSVELAGRDAAVPAIGAFRFTVLVVVIVFLMALTLPALALGAFDSPTLIYCVITSLVAWGTYRAKSIARALVMLVLAALAFLALAGGVFHSSYDGNPRSDGPGGASLADLVTGLRKEHKLVGLAAMVMVDGKVMASAADGERKIRSGVPIELGDRWHLGSITKSVTATMIARLIESGQMKWTDTIGERFPDAAIHEDWKAVTLQQLLTHTSGAPANFPLGVRLKKPALGPECTQERRQAVIDVMAEKPAHSPGEKFAYSNVGYTIAGAMAESATGVSWEDLVKR